MRAVFPVRRRFEHTRRDPSIRVPRQYSELEKRFNRSLWSSRFHRVQSVDWSTLLSAWNVQKYSRIHSIVFSLSLCAIPASNGILVNYLQATLPSCPVYVLRVLDVFVVTRPWFACLIAGGRRISLSYLWVCGTQQERGTVEMSATHCQLRHDFYTHLVFTLEEANLQGLL